MKSFLGPDLMASSELAYVQWQTVAACVTAASTAVLALLTNRTLRSAKVTQEASQAALESNRQLAGATREMANQNQVLARQSQARSVSAWLDDPHSIPAHATLANSSTEPVFQVVMSLVGIQGAGPPTDASEAPGNYEFRTCVGVLPPGEFHFDLPSAGHAMNIHLAIEVAFSDGAGVHWVRHGDGILSELPCSAPDYYSLPRPIHWVYADHSHSTSGSTR